MNGPATRRKAVRPYIGRGQVVPVLAGYSTPFPGFYLCYPRRRQASPALRARVDYLLQARRREAAGS